jgi:hypothetical protein
VRELILAQGPARYLGGSIETFALPVGAFIVIATALYYIFRRPHHVPRMKYLEPATQTSVGTREPGTTGLTVVHGPIPASAPVAEATTSVPGGQPPNASETVLHPDVAADRQAAVESQVAARQAAADGPAASGTADQAAAEGPTAPDAADQAEGDA